MPDYSELLAATRCSILLPMTPASRPPQEVREIQLQHADGGQDALRVASEGLHTLSTATKLQRLPAQRTHMGVKFLQVLVSPALTFRGRGHEAISFRRSWKRLALSA